MFSHHQKEGRFLLKMRTTMYYGDYIS
jgi:hypothetical protein